MSSIPAEDELATYDDLRTSYSWPQAVCVEFDLMMSPLSLISERQPPVSRESGVPSRLLLPAHVSVQQ
jgi:hypothetical protein